MNSAAAVPISNGGRWASACRAWDAVPSSRRTLNGHYVDPLPGAEQPSRCRPRHPAPARQKQEVT